MQVSTSKQMSNAFLDTTVVCDALLAPQKRRDAVQRTVASFADSEVCEYAFREFGAGPLGTWIYAYNTLAIRDTVEEAVQQLQRASSFQPRRGWGAVTAIVAGLQKAAAAGPQPEESVRDALLAFILREIEKAWSARRSVAKRNTLPLACLRNDDFEL